MSLRPSIWESINKNLFNAPSDPRDLPSRNHHTGDRSQPGKFLRRKIQKEVDKRMPRGFKRKRPIRHNPAAKRQKFSFLRRNRRNARRVTRRLRRLGYLREELKLLQGTTGGSNVAYDAPIQEVYPPSGMTQGDGIGNRDGRKVFLKYLYLKGYIYANDSTDPIGNQKIRVRIIWVRNTDNGTFNINEVFEDSGAVGDVYALRKAKSNQPFNFRVLYDKIWSFKETNESSTTHNFRKYIKLNRFSNFSGTGAAETDISNGKLILHWTSNIASTGSEPQVFYNWRLRFQDA